MNLLWLGVLGALVRSKQETEVGV